MVLLMDLQGTETYLYLLSERDEPGDLKCKLSPPLGLHASLPLEVGITEIQTSDKCLILSSRDEESKLRIASKVYEESALISSSTVDMTRM